LITLTGTTIEALFRLKTLVESFLILWLSKAREGRKGVKAKEKSSTRRDPSLFEHEAIELPSSTAPAALETRKPMPLISSSEEATTIQIRLEIGPKWDTVENSFIANLSTTALGILRGASSDKDPYEAGTLRDLRSLHPNKLAEQVDEDELDNKDNEIHENGEKDFVDIDYKQREFSVSFYHSSPFSSSCRASI
jgi:hypothetical protein